MALTRYQVKRALLTPRTLYMRRKMREHPERARRMLELHHYDRPMLDFMAATVERPDILVDFDLDPDSVVVDVGGFHGHWSEKVSSRFGSRIHAFEPGPAAFRHMDANLAEHPNVVRHDFGLGGADLDATLSRRGPGSTVFGSDDEVGADPVRIRDVARAFDELGLDEVDLLKVNIEGGEYDLLDRLADTGRLPRVRLVLVQFHEWLPGAHRRRRRNRRALERTHDEVWDYPWVWELWRRR